MKNWEEKKIEKEIEFDDSRIVWKYTMRLHWSILELIGKINR